MDYEDEQEEFEEIASNYLSRHGWQEFTNRIISHTMALAALAWLCGMAAGYAVHRFGEPLWVALAVPAFIFGFAGTTRYQWVKHRRNGLIEWMIRIANPRKGST